MSEPKGVGPMPAHARVALLEAKLGQPMPDVARALAAITHTSWCNEHKDESAVDNERLEFLGDAVVDLAISDRLIQRLPSASEGELTRLRAAVVNEEGLAKVARVMELGEVLLLGRGEERSGGRDKSSVLANALEAVLGALYLSSGMTAVLTAVDRWFAAPLDAVCEGREARDFKSLLQTDVQSRLKTAPRYRVVGESGPDHEKVFEVEVSINDDVYARSTGRSKKEAEQSAAEKALARLVAPSA